MKISLLILIVLCTTSVTYAASLSTKEANPEMAIRGKRQTGYSTDESADTAPGGATTGGGYDAGGYGGDGGYNGDSTSDITGDGSWDSSGWGDSSADSGTPSDGGSDSANDSSSDADRPLRPQRPQRNRWHGNQMGNGRGYQRHHSNRNNQGENKTPLKSIQFSYFFGNGWK